MNMSQPLFDSESGDVCSSRENVFPATPSTHSTNSVDRSQIEDTCQVGPPNLSKSCDDLVQDVIEESLVLVRSQSFQSLNSNGSQTTGKYDHVQSKIKQYISVLGKNSYKSEAVIPIELFPAKNSKENYLQEINLRLTRELEEKNVILNQLQQNYEHLLLKYAEAQNKIDNLRVQTLKVEQNNGNEKTSLHKKHIAPPSVYSRTKIDNVKQNFGKDPDTRVDRPSTLPVDSNLKVFNKDGLQAVTPTDSEGVSSVITSMSGHSKILNNFDDQPGEDQNDNSGSLKSDVLEKALEASDPFDKVKNWQNSLPPLEFIETPETALYDVEPITPSTMYNELPVSDSEKSLEITGKKCKVTSQAVMKKYLRTLSLPSSLTRRNMLSQIYKRRNNHTIDLTSPMAVDSINTLRPQPVIETPSSPKPPPTRMIQHRKKRPPFLRSVSLPAYDCESPRIRSLNVPPLDLDNLTLSDDETSPLNALTSPSFLSTHDYSFQTFDSRNSCKATLSEFSISSRSKDQSTPVLPNRGSLNFSQSEFSEALLTRDECCAVCGETVLSTKAGSSQAIYLKSQDTFLGSSVQKSHSFNSECSSPTRCLHNSKRISMRDDTELFDVYTSNLKARSDVILKALNAHVKHS